MKTRIGVCAAALALCAAVTASAEAAEIPAWAAGAVERWDACGKLDEAMSLDHTLTRRELAVVLDSVLPTLEETAGLSYTDLTAGSPENDAMLRLAAAGILQGDGLGRLYPEDTATRQELAVLLCRAFYVKPAAGTSYTDAAAIAPWALDAVSSLQQAGIMVGSEGCFLPDRELTYGEALQAVNTALTVTGQMTGLTVETRNEAGVLAEGQPGQVNDGKFSITAVEETGGGYVIRLQGLEALTGEEADSAGPGAPATDGKWMGLCLTFHGLVCVDELQYSLDGENWTALAVSESLDEGRRSQSVMLYVNGTEPPAADGPETERERTLAIRQTGGAWSTRLTVHYTPAEV